MNPSLLDLLACPENGGPLTLRDEVRDAHGRIVTGQLLSSSGRAYPIRGGIPRFVDSDKYVTSFTMQRKYMQSRFDNWARETGREERFTRLTGFDLGSAKGKLFLDAGCGYGRYAAVVAQAGGTLVGVDLSTDSIELANRYLGDRDNVHLIQGDLQSLPLKRALFDAVYSIGVLHHTPDTRASFQALIPFVKPGQRIAIWVYAPEDKRFDDVLRLATVHMPSWSVLGVGAARHVLGQSVRRVLLRRKEARVFSSFWPDIMGQFDSLAPRYAFVHTAAEVQDWFKAAGLQDIRTGGLRTSVNGARPLS